MINVMLVAVSSLLVDREIFAQEKVRRLPLLFLSMQEKSLPWQKGIYQELVWFLVYELVDE